MTCSARTSAAPRSTPTCAQGYPSECPNVGKLLSNLNFSLDMENEIMGEILNNGKDPKVAGIDWLKANPGCARRLA